MIPGAANERWAMDFIHDQLADGTAFRVLSMADLYTRECVGLVPAVRLRADDVIAALNRLRDERGIPAVIQCDNGTVELPDFRGESGDQITTLYGRAPACGPPRIPRG